MRLTSPAFADGGAIPERYTCDGENVSPPLSWDEVPEGTQAFALTVQDPDARDFVHWLLSNISGDVGALPDGEGDAVGIPGPNNFRSTGWGGPCPPSGEHRYVFTLYALSAPVTVTGTLEQLLPELQHLAVGKAQLTGVYRRRR
jgi:Raf kinase inhibitor-like YbhB/YbcL family protein